MDLQQIDQRVAEITKRLKPDFPDIKVGIMETPAGLITLSFYWDKERNNYNEVKQFRFKDVPSLDKSLKKKLFTHFLKAWTRSDSRKERTNRKPIIRSFKKQIP